MQNSLKQERITEISQLYELADTLGVGVVGFCMPESRAMSLMDEHGRCMIGLDNSRNYSLSEQKTMLAHELGHCRTGAFYNQYTPLSLREKCEKKADEWAILHCVPFDALIFACKSGIHTRYELAEYFGVSEHFMKKAIDYYLQRRK